VFLTVPTSAWVAENDLAFAIRDRFPVSPGHTLVITKRLVPDWFSATRDEQLAVLALIDVVKAALDAELGPQGYNVGFNAGAAAGQTVPHLHVHVIPRFEGDMEDPRGGVRHVIPEKGNYLKGLAAGAAPLPPPPRASPLATGGAEDPFARHVLPLFDRATDVAIVAAFVMERGLARIEAAVDGALARGARVRIVTGDYLAITQSEALKKLLDWQQASGVGEGDDAPAGCFDARIIETETLAPMKSFHPKSWRFESGTLGVAFVGSSNLSHAALGEAIEWNLRVDRDRDPEAYARVRAAFEQPEPVPKKHEAQAEAPSFGRGKRLAESTALTRAAARRAGQEGGRVPCSSQLARCRPACDGIVLPAFRGMNALDGGVTRAWP